MSKELSVEDRISILLTTIFDEGIDNYPHNLTKLQQRLNEFYDTNKVDIINYFTKVIMFIPTKGTIYSNALFNLGKADIINNIFKKLVDELSKNKNGFVFIRSFIFIFGLIHFGILQNDQLINFILENIAKRNINLLKIIIRSICLIYRKNNEYQFLIQSINVIYESNIMDKSDIIFTLLHSYANSEQNLDNKGNKFDGFFIKDIILNPEQQQNANNDNDINMIDNKSLDVDNIFNELNNINYDNIFCPELTTRRHISGINISFLDIYYELFLMNNIEAFKDESNESITELYLFSLPSLYYKIKDKEQNNNILPYQFIIDNITFASIDLILYPFWTKGDLCYIVNFILYILSQKKSYFTIISEENKEQNIYINFITAILSNVDFLEKLSPFQLNNLIFFLYHIISNISEAKTEILIHIQKLSNDDNNINNCTLQYFINSFYEKMSNIIKKDSLPSEINFPSKNFIPNKNDAINNLPNFKKISSEVNRNIPFNNFENKDLFDKDEQNELLYTFVYCLLYSSKPSSLSKIYDNIEQYSEALRDIINKYNNEGENDKMKTILKVIFDLYGHLPLYYTYIIDLFAFKNLLDHTTIINFIFTEKLFQKKENGLICSFYELINNCVENCYSMLTKYDDDFQNLARSFSKVDENKRKEMQLKMEFYDNEVEKLKKQKEVICDKILEMFIKMYEMSERLGGGQYKDFIQKVIKDEYGLFITRYKVSDDWNEKFKI